MKSFILISENKVFRENKSIINGIYMFRKNNYKKKEELACITCGKKFSNQKSLVQHERGKHKKKKYDKSKK